MKRAIGCLLLLTGCMVGPKYQKPETAMPESFSESELACSDEDLCLWWKQFNDPLLDDMVERAFQANYDLLIAFEKIEEARAQYRIEGSYLWPEIDLNAAATRSRFSQNVFTTAANAESFASGDSNQATRGSGFGPPVQNFFQVGFDAVWELDFWGKFRRGKKAAFEMWEATQSDAQSVLITVISEVVRNYVSIRSLQQQIELTKRKIEADERELMLGQDLFESGVNNEIQVNMLYAVLEQDQATLPLLETSLKTTIYSLAILLAQQPEEFASLFDEIAPIPVGIGKVPSGLPSDLLRRRPDIRSAERQLAAATEQIGIAIADLFPHISLTGNAFGYEANQLNKWIVPSSNYWSIGPSINWNLINFGRTRAQIAVANSVQRQAFLTYEQTVITSLQDVEGALVAYFEEQKRNLYLTERVATLTGSLELTEDLFQSGLNDELQVLSALKAQLDAEQSLIQSSQAITSNLVSLYKALGGNWECSSTP